VAVVVSGVVVPRPGEDHAIQAASVALANWQLGFLAPQMNDETKKQIVERAYIAVSAAYPVIAAAILSEIEQRLDALKPPTSVQPDSPYWMGHHSGRAAMYIEAWHAVADLRRGLVSPQEEPDA
jgi:hypothetical protein